MPEYNKYDPDFINAVSTLLMFKGEHGSISDHETRHSGQRNADCSISDHETNYSGQRDADGAVGYRSLLVSDHETIAGNAIQLVLYFPLRKSKWSMWRSMSKPSDASLELTVTREAIVGKPIYGMLLCFIICIFNFSLLSLSYVSLFGNFIWIGHSNFYLFFGILKP